MHMENYKSGLGFLGIVFCLSGSQFNTSSSFSSHLSCSPGPSSNSIFNSSQTFKIVCFHIKLITYTATLIQAFYTHYQCTFALHKQIIFVFSPLHVYQKLSDTQEEWLIVICDICATSNIQRPDILHR